MRQYLFSKWVLIFSMTPLIMACHSFPYHDPAKKHWGPDTFLNNYDNSPKESFWKWQWERLTKPKVVEPPFQPEVVKTDLEFLTKNRSAKSLTWVGHSTALLQLNGLNIIMDPVFSDRVSPVSFFGPKRVVPLPFEVSALPAMDIVLISHSHYDHLDYFSVKSIDEQNAGKTLFLVPLGVASWFREHGIENVKEFDWWDEVKIGEMIFTFTPAQHWTQRTPWDYKKSLWGGWSVKSEKFHFLYTGDTGYSLDFKDIRSKLGKVHVAMIPIGAYEPRWFMGKQHVDPDGAVRIHQDLEADFSIGVHWGTFTLADEPMAEPPLELARARERKGLSPSVFRVLKHGEIWMIE